MEKCLPSVTILPSAMSTPTARRNGSRDLLTALNLKISWPFWLHLQHVSSIFIFLAIIIVLAAASTGLETWAPVKEAAPVAKPQKNTGLSDKQIKKAEKARKKAAKKAAKKAKKAKKKAQKNKKKKDKQSSRSEKKANRSETKFEMRVRKQSSRLAARASKRNPERNFGY